METYYPNYNIDLNDFPRGLPDEVMGILKPKKHRRLVMVENCYVLSLSDLGKGLLRATNEWKEDYPEPLDSDIKPQGKKGQTTLHKRCGSPLQIYYSVDLSEEPFILHFSYTYRNSAVNDHIELDSDFVSYGMRPFLLCTCGYRGNKLYLSPDDHYFRCRECSGLFYESTTINKHSFAGEAGYLFSRHVKLDEQKAKVKRIVYAGKITKKAKRIEDLIHRYTTSDAMQKMMNEKVQV